MSGYIGLLRNNPNYAYLWMSQAVSLLGDWFSTISLSIIAMSLSDGSSLAVSGVLLARFLPPVLLSPLAGVLADRVDRKKILIFSDLARMVVVLLFLFAIRTGQLWVFYGLLTLQFSLSAFFEPARSALLPSVVTPEYLVKANLLSSITWSAMLALGAAIGGGVATIFGVEAAIIGDAFTFAISALLLLPVKTNNRTIISSDQLSSADVKSKKSFIEGLRYIRRNPSVAITLLIKTGGSIGSDDIVMAIYATQFFVLGADGTGSLGILYGAFGIGAILGPLLLDRLNNGSIKAMSRLILVGYVFVSLGWFLFSYAPTLYFAAFALMVRAMGSALYWAYSSVILQKTVPDKYLGRLFALDIAGYRLATVLSILFTGWSLNQASSEGVRQIVLYIGLISLLPIALLALALSLMDGNEIEDKITYNPFLGH